MPFVGKNNDIIIEIPNEGNQSWYELIRNECFLKLVEHDHTGNGKGRPLGTASIADGAINQNKILLDNNSFLKAKDGTGLNQLNVIKVDGYGSIVTGRPILELNSDIRLHNDAPQSLNISSPTGPGEVRLAYMDLTMENGTINAENSNLENIKTEDISLPTGSSKSSITFNDDVEIDGNLEADNLVATTELESPLIDTDKVETPNVTMQAVSADPGSPIDGQIQYSDGTHRAQGLWQYQGSAWVSLQGEVGANSVSTASIQNGAVTGDKIDNGAVTTNKVVDLNITNNKIANDTINRAKMAPEFGNIFLGFVLGSANLTSTMTKHGVGFIKVAGDATITIDTASNNGGKVLHIMNVSGSVRTISVSSGGRTVSLGSMANNTCRTVLLFFDDVYALASQAVTVGT